MSTGVSIIKAIGKDVEKGFEWLLSPKGQNVVKEAEVAIDLSFPPAEPVVALVDAWMQKAEVVEGKAAAAASLGANVTSVQKATAAIDAVAPDVEAILTKYNLTKLSADSLAKINDAVLTIANELQRVPAAAPTA